MLIHQMTMDRHLQVAGLAHGAFSEDVNQNQMKLLKMCKKLKILFLSLSLSHGSLLRGLLFWGEGMQRPPFKDQPKQSA